MLRMTPPPETAALPRALTVTDFCRNYGISRSGFYNLIKARALPDVKVGGRRLIPTDAAEALLRGRMATVD